LNQGNSQQMAVYHSGSALEHPGHNAVFKQQE
jgi:hypothetical protein